MPDTAHADLLAKQEAHLRLRRPVDGDGLRMWTLVRTAGGLDPNSAYCYAMLCRYFAETCVVADGEVGLAGFLTAYRVPSRPNTLFVWQVAVAPEARRTGLATRMLAHLLSSDACAGVRYVEATIAPSNVASQALFRRLAEARGVDLSVSHGFAPDLFDAGHEGEELYRVGPL